ncbi:hypothetical protein B0J17DRAFT_677838 [Rhizoctonia solani]|nr:hypothetical protein B0J17DRAFT_677838 [Rhizoctonia solani]
MGTSAKSAASTYWMREVEDPTPLSRRLPYHFSAAKEIIKLVHGVGDSYGFHNDFGEMPFMTRVWLATRIFPMFLFFERLGSYDMNDSYDVDEIEEFTEQGMEHAWLVGLYEAIRSPLCNTHDKSMVALSDVEFDEQDWVHSLQVCVGRQINHFVRQQCTPVGHVAVHAGTSDSPRTVHMTVAEFQEYTIQRIQVHANRVAALGLAAAKLVQNEIETTMAKVWKGMPGKKNWGWLDTQPSESGNDLGGLVEDYALSGLFFLD